MAPRRPLRIDTEMPALWQVLCRDILTMERPLAHEWWDALCASPWTECASLKSLVLLVSCRPLESEDGLRALLEESLQPSRLVQVTEDLCRQRLLTRQQASEVQEAVLQQTDKEGMWL